MTSKTRPIQPNQYYHIYNKSISDCKLFITKKDYQKFEKSVIKYLLQAFSLYTYCLIPNHFHFLVKVRSEKEQTNFIENISSNAKKQFQKPYRQLSHLFNSYAQYYNRKYDRKGSLFLRPFRRILVDSERYFNRLVCYIHQNPLHHGIQKDYLSYPYSSIKFYQNRDDGLLTIDETIMHFGGWDNFWNAHAEIENELTEDITLEG